MVLDDARKEGCEQILCLGDMVDGGEHNDEVVRALIAAKARVVIGNHDEFNDLALAPDVQAYGIYDADAESLEIRALDGPLL